MPTCVELDSLSYAVEPGLLFGRPGPAKSRWDLARLKARGLHSLFSLVPLPTQDQHEVKRVGLVHYSVDFAEKLHQPYKTANAFLIPILDQFDRILAAHLPRRQPVLVHCNSGKDRTGFLLSYYLMTRRGWPARKAVREIRRLKEDALTAGGFEETFLAMEQELRVHWQSKRSQ